jgi:hypothetical protein
MSGAEILAAISIAAEVAGDVKVIVEGIESVIGFVKGLQGKNRDSTKELQALITTIKTEIIQFLENQQRAEMFAKIYASNNYWVDEALVQIKSSTLAEVQLSVRPIY